ncbi:hypothetical protein LJC63_01975 [Ruminococcaceae bacterium OttesenSCG-928-L11]|nr:hypothetical protein [Ruminococcaceae bacterium OttesenSCG-928-L11]
MIKRLIPALLAVLVLCTPAYAAEPELPDGVTVTDITEHGVETDYTLPEHYPTDIQTKTEDGVKLLLKTFEVGQDVQPSALMEDGLAQNGVEYELRDILRKTAPDGQESKTISQSVTVSCESDKREDILSLLPESIAYAESGFTGQLSLDESSISIEVESSEGYRYAISDTREYTGLVRNDPYLIPKTVQKSGVTLTLCDVKWSPGADYDPNPASYSATAYYSGSASGSRPSGYTASATYSGEVVKAVPGNITYTLVYTEKIMSVELPTGINWTPVLLGLVAVIVAAGIATGVLLLLRRRKENMVPAYADGMEEIPKKRMRKPDMLSELEDDDESY